ncbi:MAG: CYTH domain-containing protein [Chloroflexia bacterium]
MPRRGTGGGADRLRPPGRDRFAGERLPALSGLDPDALRAALTRSLGTRLVVEKRRALYLWGHTRIHLDRVTDLGPFVELETVVEHFSGTAEERQAGAEAEHRRVIALLGLDRLPAIAGSYSDLLAASD